MTWRIAHPHLKRRQQVTPAARVVAKENGDAANSGSLRYANRQPWIDRVELTQAETVVAPGMCSHGVYHVGTSARTIEVSLNLCHRGESRVEHRQWPQLLGSDTRRHQGQRHEPRESTSQKHRAVDGQAVAVGAKRSRRRVCLKILVGRVGRDLVKDGIWSSSASNKSVAQSKVGGERPARWPQPMAAANPGGSHGRGGGVASAAARASRTLAAAPPVRVVGGENLLCAPAGWKHKEKFSQVQVLMQQTITGVIRSQSLAPKAAQAATLAASSAASAALGVLCAQLDIPSIVPPDPAASKPKSQKHTRATATDATPTASSSHETTASGSASSALMTVGTTYTTTHATAYEQRLMKMRRVTRQTDTTNTAIRSIVLQAPSQPAPSPELGDHARGALVVVRPHDKWPTRHARPARTVSATPAASAKHWRKAS